MPLLLPPRFFFGSVAPMRKLLAITMTATLLLVSGVPMSSAKECAMPMPDTGIMADMHAMHGMQQSADQQEMHAAHDMHEMHGGEMSMQHEHAAAPQPRGRLAEIKSECCCSFHGLIDSLPHLLAPHMTSDIAMLTEAGSESGLLYVETAWLVRKARIPLPPPELIS